MNTSNRCHQIGVYENLAVNLRTLRTINGLSQESVSQLVHTSRKHYCNCENGSAFPDLVTVCILADLYRVQIDALITAKISREAFIFLCRQK